MDQPCAVCGFEASRWSDQDLVTTLAAIPLLIHYAVERADPLPAGVLVHVAAVRAAFPDDDPSAGAATTVELDELLADLRTQADVLTRASRPVRELTSDGRRQLQRVAHATQHQLRLIGRDLAADGHGASPATGVVEGLHRSDGGVPKPSVGRIDVGWTGVGGDRQNDRKHHGRPFQALCLWSADVIDDLRAEGHPIEPGFAGENVTIRGLDWGDLRPGTVIEVGSARVEVSAYAVPCAKNAEWFVDGDFRRMQHERHPGWSRLYAWVQRPGVVAVGDPVTVEPASL